MSRTVYVRQVLLADPPRCSICGICKRNYPGIAVRDYEGVDVCDLCIVEASRGATMSGDAQQGRPEKARRRRMTDIQRAFRR